MYMCIYIYTHTNVYVYVYVYAYVYVYVYVYVVSVERSCTHAPERNTCVGIYTYRSVQLVPNRVCDSRCSVCCNLCFAWKWRILRIVQEQHRRICKNVSSIVMVQVIVEGCRARRQRHPDSDGPHCLMVPCQDRCNSCVCGASGRKVGVQQLVNMALNLILQRSERSKQSGERFMFIQLFACPVGTSFWSVIKLCPCHLCRPGQPAPTEFVPKLRRKALGTLLN